MMKTISKACMIVALTILCDPSVAQAEDKHSIARKYIEADEAVFVNQKLSNRGRKTALRRSKPSRNSEPPKRERSLGSKKSKSSKSSAGSKGQTENSRIAGMERVIVSCGEELSQEDCVEYLDSLSEDGIHVIHSLKSAKSVAAEVDPSVRNQLDSVGLKVIPDESREPLYIPESMTTYDRHLFNQQDLKEEQILQYGVSMINAPAVWERYGAKGDNITICVIDTGIEANHTDFEKADLAGYSGTDAITPWDKDVRGHGTHVSGIIVASDNDVGVVGVAPNVKLYTVRAFKNNGNLHGSDVVAAAEACRDAGANIISMSLGGRGISEAEQDLFEELYSEGIVAVASAGNTAGPDRIYPAAYDKVISVASCNEEKSLSGFSTFNSAVDIAAPGDQIWSTQKNGGYVAFSGTSMSAPHVSGALALILSYKPDLSPEELKSLLLQTAQEPAQDIELEIGIVDTLAAIELLESGTFEVPPEIECVETDLLIQTDMYGSETAYRLRRVSDGAILWSGFGLASYEDYIERECLARNECYLFQIRDTYGDGIMGNGVLLTYDGTVEFEGGDFGYGGFLFFGDC